MKETMSKKISRFRLGIADFIHLVYGGVITHKTPDGTEVQFYMCDIGFHNIAKIGAKACEGTDGEKMFNVHRPASEDCQKDIEMLGEYT